MSQSQESQKSQRPRTVDQQLADYRAAQLRWVQCLRKHGLNVTDPDRNGQVRFPSGLDKTSAATDRAMRQCRRYQTVPSPELEERLQPKLTKSELAAERRYATCMRSLGISGFPDPTPKGFPKGTWDPTSPQAISAGDTCYRRVYGPLGTPSG